MSQRRHDEESWTVRHAGALSLAVVGLALALRLPDLFGWWLNPDEGAYYAALTQERFSLFWAEAFATAHPPLYFLILRAMSFVSTDFVWLRALALVSGCGAVYVLILVGREVGGDGAHGHVTGLAAGLVLALSPRAITLSQVIRPYMLLVLLLGLALYSLLRYLRQPSGRLLGLYVASASLAAFLHYSAALGLAAIGTYVVFDGVVRGPSRPEWLRLLAVQLVPGAVLGILYATHLRELMGSTVAEFALTGWLSGYLIHAPGDVWLSVAGLYSMLTGSTAAFSMTLLSLVGLAWAAYQRAWRPLLPAASGLVIATVCASLELYPFGAGRHSSWLLPLVIPAVAWTFVTAVTTVRRTPLLAVAAAVALLAGVLLRSPLGEDLLEPAAREHVLREAHLAALSEVLDPAGPPRVVVMSFETFRMLIPLYAVERQRARMSPDRTFAHFRWGSRDVLVLPGLDIAARPDQIDQPNHLVTGTRRAAAGFDVDLPGGGEPVLVLSGGWQVQGVFELTEIARSVGLEGAAQSVPGLITLTLDLEAYGRALDDLTG